MKIQNKRAQSAVEYLMTYGWAILVIIVVGAALWKLGVFDVSKYTGSAKMSVSGFTVSGSQLRTTQFSIKMGSQESITVYDFNLSVAGVTPTIATNQAGFANCTDGTAANVGYSGSNPATWSPNTEKDITCGTFSALTSGSLANTRIDILYKDASGYFHTTTGTYNPKVE